MYSSTKSHALKNKNMAGFKDYTAPQISRAIEGQRVLDLF